MIGWEHVWEFILRLALRRGLRNQGQIDRFIKLSRNYIEIYRQLSEGLEQEKFDTPGYDWDSWSENVRRSFEAGVPLGFLANPTLVHTMVFARRRGVLLSKRRIDYVASVLGPQTSQMLLREDYIGLPTITHPKFLTSANRSHHASHLACYTAHTQRKFWNTSSITEWGGGYGNMARILRRMNQSVTYTIVDLPEMLALQYIYLASLENEESIHLVLPTGPLDIVQDKINLVPAHFAARHLPKLTSESFISTWALTESQCEIQQAVLKCHFFGAQNLLIGSMVNPNNALAKAPLDNLGIYRVPVPHLGALGAGNEYWFR